MLSLPLRLCHPLILCKTPLSYPLLQQCHRGINSPLTCANLWCPTLYTVPLFPSHVPSLDVPPSTAVQLWCHFFPHLCQALVPCPRSCQVWVLEPRDIPPRRSLLLGGIGKGSINFMMSFIKETLIEKQKVMYVTLRRLNQGRFLEMSQRKVVLCLVEGQEARNPSVILYQNEGRKD